MAELLVEKLTMIRRKRLPRSIRKYIRQEKARLRRKILDLPEQRKQIEEMYEKILKSLPKNT